jgi:hypothetical protein
MATKLNIATKSDYALRPSIPTNQKQSATEFNSLVNAINANYERLVLDWSVDVTANSTLAVGQKILFTDGVLYRITTSYNVGNPITWNAANARKVSSSHLRGAYDLSITNDYPVTGNGSADDGSFVYGDEFYVSVAGTLELTGGLGVQPVGIGTIIKYLTGDPTLPASWRVIQAN